ncbi:MAG: hypothetical protein M9949_12440 [Candidatus Kapabacteria bacterium]|nr:hypothetical protein [Candidatus Kapabacteria bacterium]
MNNSKKTYRNKIDGQSESYSERKVIAEKIIIKLGDFYYDKNGLIKIFSQTNNNKSGIVFNQKV